MDFQERQKIINRIISKTVKTLVDYNYQSYAVTFVDPSLQIKVEADYVQSSLYDKLKKDDGALTYEQSLKILRDDGIWTKKIEEEQKTLEKDIKTLQDSLPALKFQVKRYRTVKKTIDKIDTRLVEINKLKNQLWSSTIEYMTDRAKNHCTLSKITTIDPIDLLSSPNFLDVLVDSYYFKNGITEKTIRLLARTDPWRLYWTLSKDTATPLFPCSCVEITDWQYALVSWSKVYDFAYQSQNRPSDDIIDDDDAFSSWYRGEIKRIESENKRSQIENGQTTMSGVGFQESFIIADEEGAKEVYALNDAMGRNNIKKRQEFIETKGEVTEANLPDVKQHILMEANRTSMNK